MTKLKLLSASLIAAAVVATPAMAREGHATKRYLTDGTDAAATPAAHYVDGHLCIPAPRVGAFATQPWDNSPPCEPESGF